MLRRLLPAGRIALLVTVAAVTTSACALSDADVAEVSGSTTSIGVARPTSDAAPDAGEGDETDAPSPTTRPAPSTSTARPDPLGAAPVEPLAPPLVSTDVGFSPGSVLLNLDRSEQLRDLDHMIELGATWIRIDVDWSRIEPERGRYDWSNLDGLVIGARQRGLHVLGLLAYTPQWARPDGTPDKAPPIDADDFADFVGEAVDRYRRHIRVWEIWNEPNVSSFWHPSPDPAAYAEVLVGSAAAIREADPDALVVTGGLAPALDDPGREISPRSFLDGLYDLVPPETFDAVGIHPYTYPGFPTEQQDWNTFASLPALQQVMADRGDADTPLWLTEFGAPTGRGQRAVSEDDQARMIEEAIVGSRNLPWVGPLFVYALRDLADGADDDIEANFGVLRADGSPKPSAVALRELLEPDPGG